MPSDKTKDSSAKHPGRDYRTRVIVKFESFVNLPYEDGVERHFREKQIGPWKSLIEKYPGLSFVRYFTSVEPAAIRELEARAQQMDSTYRSPDLLKWFAVEVPEPIDPEEVAQALRKWHSIQTAYVEPKPQPPPFVAPDDDPEWPNQGHIDPAPDGVDAEYAWTIPGGDGAGVGFVDLEQGWTFNHEDLIDHDIELISGVSQAYWGHGTAALGIVCAFDNDLGCVGIAPNLPSVRVVSEWRDEDTFNTADAILSAVAVMAFGDILLLEAQEGLLGIGNGPSEGDPVQFDAIRLATALGIVVVEAGGNGGGDLDTWEDAGGFQVLNRASADFRDSGAIMVGSAVSAVPHARTNHSTYGSRIDCYAWGENINTTGNGWAGNHPQHYTTDFGGTSGASAIIAGVAVVVQGLAEANLGYRLSPLQMRAILSDPALGTPSADPPEDRIGVMPNLRAIVDGDVLNLAPDVYLRDNLADTGDPHGAAISSSPDIILRPEAVADPQGSFGEGSGTENDNTLGSEAEAGQDNFIYVRARNRGGTDAANVTATVYWSLPATLLTPDLWTLVGSVVLPEVPVGDVLTVSDAITWPSGEIPGPGHYCFVGLIGNAQDPAPTPAEFLDWQTYRTFIRSNNNVTWRNFNVVNNAPPPNADPPNFVPLSFLAPGAPDITRIMRVEIVSRLPRGSRILLELPAAWLNVSNLRRVRVEPVPQTGNVRIPINPAGTTLLGPLPFPPKSRTALRLLVQIPGQLRNRSYTIYARQLFERDEVGRVTWRLSPRRR
jgi:serine protease